MRDRPITWVPQIQGRGMISRRRHSTDSNIGLMFDIDKKQLMLEWYWLDGFGHSKLGSDTLRRSFDERSNFQEFAGNTLPLPGGHLLAPVQWP